MSGWLPVIMCVAIIAAFIAAAASGPELWATSLATPTNTQEP